MTVRRRVAPRLVSQTHGVGADSRVDHYRQRIADNNTNVDGGV